MSENPDTKKIPLPSGAPPPNSQVIPKTLPGVVTQNKAPQAPPGDPKDVNKESLMEQKPPPQGKPPPKPQTPKDTVKTAVDTKADPKAPVSPKQEEKHSEVHEHGGCPLIRLTHRRRSWRRR